MTRRRQFPIERLLCAGAAAALLVSGGWAWHQASHLRRLKSSPAGIRLGAGRYLPEESARSEAGRREWIEPPAGDSEGWNYDVFTPPEIRYDANTRRFTVEAPREEDDAVFGLELLAVNPQLYRLQLAGYFGGPDNLVGTFVSPDLPGSIVARAGQRLESLGLVLQTLELKRLPEPGLRFAAEAVVHDEISGAEVTLDSRVRKFTETPVAVLKPAWMDEGTRELHQGDSIASERATYCIERIQLNPPEVLVSQRIFGGAEVAMHVLHPAGTTAGENGARVGGFATGRPAASLASVAK